MYTYFFQAVKGGPIKIGKSRNHPTIRLKACQTGCPDELRIVGYIQKNVESELHDRFSKHHVRGEWFHPHPELLEFLANDPAVKGMSVPRESVMANAGNSALKDLLWMASAITTTEWRHYEDPDQILGILPREEMTEDYDPEDDDNDHNVLWRVEDLIVEEMSPWAFSLDLRTLCVFLDEPHNDASLRRICGHAVKCYDDAEEFGCGVRFFIGKSNPEHAFEIDTGLLYLRTLRDNNYLRYEDIRASHILVPLREVLELSKVQTAEAQ